MFAQFLYHHSRYFYLFVLAVVAVGYTSFNSIARQEDPTIVNMVASITVPYPGASADRVEALITKPLEDELRKIPEVFRLQTTSANGISLTNVRLQDTLSGENMELAWTEVRDAMADAAMRFPADAGKPLFDNDRLKSFTSIVAISARDDKTLSLGMLSRFAKQFADIARNHPGTELVEIFGEPQEEIRVSLNLTALTARGLGPTDVANALQRADAKFSAGRLSNERNDLLVELAGDFDSLERIRQVTISSAGSAGAVRVGDIAVVTKTERDPPSSLALAEGKPAVLVGVVMQTGLQVDAWTNSLRTSIDNFNAQLPHAVQAVTSYEQSTYAMDRLNHVAGNLLTGVALVLLVLLLTLGWRAAMVVAVILPLCGLLSITVLEQMSFSLQQMSLSGLIVSLGLLVDGSIVMTDEIRKRLLKGLTPIQAIAGSVSRLRIPLLSSSITTILAFLPMAIMPGPAGSFLGSIATSVIVMLLASTLLALVFTPVLAAWLLPGGLRENASWVNTGIASGNTGKALANAITWSLKHPFGAISLALILPITGFLAFPTLTAQFFPGTDRDQFHIQVTLPDGSSIWQSKQLAIAIDSALREEPLIRRIDWTIGENAPAFYYNLYRFKEGIPSFAEALVLTHDKRKTNALIRHLQLQLDKKFPQARIVVRGIDQGPPLNAPVEVKVFGPSISTLQTLGEEIRRRLDTQAHVVLTSTSLPGGSPKIRLALNEDSLHLAGGNLAHTAGVLRGALNGLSGGQILEGTEQIPVRVRGDTDTLNNAEQLAALYLPHTASRSETLPGIPLSALGRPQLTVSETAISRENGERINNIQAFITRGVLPEEVLKTLQNSLAENPVALPQGYRLSFGGGSEERARTVDQIMSSVGLIMAALVATIVLTFNSWRLSAITALVCVCSLGLSLISLALFGYPFGIQAFIGVIGSVGVSVNAAIIILTALQANPAAMTGDIDAIRDVVMDSSRHIISTTITTFGGFLPLILAGGFFWPPFAMAIAGGVLLSTIISFFLVPPLFLLAYRLLKSKAIFDVTH